MLGIFNSATNSAQLTCNFADFLTPLQSGTPPLQLHSQRTIYLSSTWCQVFHSPSCLWIQAPCVVSVLQMGELRFREMVGLVEGHVAHKGQSWDLNPYLSPPQPPLGLTMISQSTGCRYQSLRSYKPHPDQKSSTRSPLTFEIHVTITKHLLIQYCAEASQ